MKKFWKTAALLTVAAVLATAVMSGCNQGTGGTGNTSGSSGLIQGSVLPAVSAADITGLWKATEGGPPSPVVMYAYYEGSGETVYTAVTPDNGDHFLKLHGFKFKDGRIVKEIGSTQNKFAVKKEGNTLKLYPISPDGTMMASTSAYTLEKDTDPAHSGWGAKIKALY